MFYMLIILVAGYINYSIKTVDVDTIEEVHVTSNAVKYTQFIFSDMCCPVKYNDVLFGQKYAGHTIKRKPIFMEKHNGKYELYILGTGGFLKIRANTFYKTESDFDPEWIMKKPFDDFRRIDNLLNPSYRKNNEN